MSTRYQRLQGPIFDERWTRLGLGSRPPWDVEAERRIEPVFNRPGFYLDRQTGRAWMELAGRAWTVSAERFRYELRDQQALVVGMSDAQSLLASASRMPRGRLRNDLESLARHSLHARRTRLEVWRSTRDSRARFLKFKQERGLV